MKPTSAHEQQKEAIREEGCKIVKKSKSRVQALLAEAEEERLKRAASLKIDLVEALMETHGLSEAEAIEKIEILGG